MAARKRHQIEENGRHSGTCWCWIAFNHHGRVVDGLWVCDTDCPAEPWLESGAPIPEVED